MTNASIVISCTPVFYMNNDTTFLQRYIGGCAEDAVLLGVSSDWVTAALSDLQNQCAILATQFRLPMNNVFCPTSTTQTCSGHGSCVNSTCVCTAPYAGYDCSINSLMPLVGILGRYVADAGHFRLVPTNPLSKAA